MIIAIDGHRFDTTKARKTWNLRYHDGNNFHEGDLYLSSRGAWYIETPSQWSNGHRWELTDVIERYSHYLSQTAIAEILELAKLETE